MLGIGGQMMEKLEHVEREVAQEVGLSLESIRELRLKHLAPEDWALERGLVRYTKNGRAKILSAVDIRPEEAPSSPPPAPAAEEPACEPDPDEKRSWTILEDPRPWIRAKLCNFYGNNRDIVLAQLLSAPFSQVTVKVGRHGADKFTVGMEIPIRHTDGAVYDLAAKKPRWRGKW